MSSEIKVDTISEKTSANGVVIDGVTLKDSKIGGTITIPGSTGTMALTSDISAGGLSEADTWIMTADLTASANPISANLARPTGTLQNYLGTGMTESSGIFTFPSTGYWLIMCHGWVTIDSNSSSGNLYIMTTNDNSTYDDIAQSRFYGNSGFQSTIRTSAIIDVTDLTNDKVRFRFAETGSSTLKGAGTEMQTGFHFIKLGDT